jgi:hypothetical protein
MDLYEQPDWLLDVHCAYQDEDTEHCPGQAVDWFDDGWLPLCSDHALVLGYTAIDWSESVS